MQTLAEIRELLDQAGMHPRKQFGQCFLFDKNLLGKLLELADLSGDQTVLEVGPGTGTLTEELLDRAGRVVAAEIDRDLCRLLRRRLGGRDNFHLIEGDVLAGKHAIAPKVLAAVDPRANLVSNLPYNIATPLVAECLLCSWRSLHAPETRFERLVVTVQQEVAERFAAPPGSGAYGPISVLAALLATVTAGPIVPATSFWPRPKVASRIVRFDFDPARAAALRSADVLQQVLTMVFGQRRKQIHSAARRRGGFVDAERFSSALADAGVNPANRPEEIAPEQYLRLANALSDRP